MRGWIDHLLYVFGYEYVGLSFSELHTLCYSFESIVKTLKGIPIQVLKATNIYNVFRRVLHYFPIARILDLFGRNSRPHPAPCSEFMAKLLIQNFDALCLESSIPFTLNNLLMMNTPFLWTRAPKLSDRELNMYIRFWMNNSTSKLEYLRLDYRSFDSNGQRPLRVFDKNAIFKGIDYIERPNDLVRDFQFSIDFHPYHGHDIRFRGGYDITRQDGTSCSVIIRTEQPLFILVVWP